MTGKSRRILLIEDNENDALIVREYVTSFGNDELIWVRSFSEMENSAQCHVAPDLVLMDLSLSDSAGLGGLKKIQDRFSGVPVIVLTGLDHEATAAQALHLGAQDYLVKNTLDADRLKRALHNAIERNLIRGELNRVNAVLETMVRRDPLTGLLNRRGLHEVLKEIQARKKRFEISTYALLIDLDEFKKINDTFGHGAGDWVLETTAHRLFDAIRETDYVARMGGDEFIVFLVDTSEAEALLVAEKIRMAIASMSVALDEGKLVQVTASFGMTPVFQDRLELDDLLKHLDSALAIGKKQGKNRIVLNGIHLPQTSEQSSNNPAELKAILGDEKYFSAVVQPIFNLGSDRVAGYEVLSRLRYPQFELPAQFLRFANTQHILPAVDRLCFASCWKIAQLLPEPASIHLNLFPLTVSDPALTDWIKQLPKNVSGHSFCVEISEQQFLGDVSYLVDGVRELRRAGFSIAIDDFGFGRTSLESLILLDPEVVKIDPSFIFGLSASYEKRAKLSRVLRLLKSNGVLAIAEGVESEADARAALELGILQGQGYWLEKPSPVIDGKYERSK